MWFGLCVGKNQMPVLLRQAARDRGSTARGWRPGRASPPPVAPSACRDRSRRIWLRRRSTVRSWRSSRSESGGLSAGIRCPSAVPCSFSISRLPLGLPGVIGDPFLPPRISRSEAVQIQLVARIAVAVTTDALLRQNRERCRGRRAPPRLEPSRSSPWNRHAIYRQRQPLA